MIQDTATSTLMLALAIAGCTPSSTPSSGKTPARQSVRETRAAAPQQAPPEAKTAARPGQTTAKQATEEKTAATDTAEFDAYGYLSENETLIHRAVCQQRKPCRLVEGQGAGRDAKGRGIFVVKVALEEGDDEPLFPYALKREPENTGESDGCTPFEYWSGVVSSNGQQKVSKLAAYCNDGYGAAGVGDDHIEIADNTFSHSQNGGSNWRWGEGIELSLSPLRVRSRHSHGSWAVDAHYTNHRWSYDTFSGTQAWYTPFCAADGSPEPSDTEAVGSESRDVEHYGYAYLLVPAVEIDADFARNGWQTVALGQCSARVDSADDRGFVVHGERGDANDASLKVVADASGRRLFIEVHDDRFVQKRPRWLHEDHLELWLGTAKPPKFGSHCIEKSKAPLQQFGILLNGKVIRERGPLQASALRVQHATAPDGSRRFSLELPAGYPALSVVYSDSDDGNSQERLIASSRLRFGVPETLGTFESISRKDATCTVQNGQLEPTVLAHFEFKP